MLQVIFHYRLSESCPRSVEQIRKKWQDMKSRAFGKNGRNQLKTGNMKCEPLNETEILIVEHYQRKNSTRISGIDGGLQSGEVMNDYNNDSLSRNYN